MEAVVPYKASGEKGDNLQDAFRERIMVEEENRVKL